MRYAGQGFEIHVDLPEGPIDESYARRAIEAFNEAYMRKHRFLDAEGTIEAVDWTLVATARAGSCRATGCGRIGGAGAAADRHAQGLVPGSRRLRRHHASSTGRRWPTGGSITGPAIVEDPDSTTVILPGDVARISPTGHLIIDIAEEGAP